MKLFVAAGLVAFAATGFQNPYVGSSARIVFEDKGGGNRMVVGDIAPEKDYQGGGPNPAPAEVSLIVSGGLKNQMWIRDGHLLKGHLPKNWTWLMGPRSEATGITLWPHEFGERNWRAVTFAFKSLKPAQFPRFKLETSISNPLFPPITIHREKAASGEGYDFYIETSVDPRDSNSGAMDVIASYADGPWQPFRTCHPQKNERGSFATLSHIKRGSRLDISIPKEAFENDYRVRAFDKGGKPVPLVSFDASDDSGWGGNSVTSGSDAEHFGQTTRGSNTTFTDSDNSTLGRIAWIELQVRPFTHLTFNNVQLNPKS